MKSNFITIHLDRLKYSDIDLLYRAIQDIILQLDAESLHLTVAFTRYCNQTEKLTGLEYKVRTKLFRENYANELKRLDELVSALLLHLKALKRADFPEFRFEVESINKFMRKELGNFVHVGADNKKNALDITLRHFDPAYSSWFESAKNLGLSRYVEELRLTRKKLDSIEAAEKNAKKGQVSSAEAIKLKAEIIKELRLLFQYIDMATLSYPEVDYTTLIARINYELKTYRAQLRNLQTRRIRKKERENQSTDQPEINP